MFIASNDSHAVLTVSRILNSLHNTPERSTGFCFARSTLIFKSSIFLIAPNDGFAFTHAPGSIHSFLLSNSYRIGKNVSSFSAPSMIVSKAVKMAEMMNIPIIGLVENMSYFKCPDNGKDYQIFGESHIEEIAEKHNLKVLAKLPIDPKISAACDKGMIELFDGNWLDSTSKLLEERLEENKK